jgi:hypothetical protein
MSIKQLKGELKVAAINRGVTLLGLLPIHTSTKGKSIAWLAICVNFPTARDGVPFAVNTPLVIDCTKV